MAITYTNKALSTDHIEIGGSFDVTLTLTAQPDMTNCPTDIVLVLDRSGSMSGQSLVCLKRAAKQFIDLIDQASDGTRSGQIGGGSRMGLASFATSATQDVSLTTSVSNLKTAVDSLAAGGSTNHADGLTKGYQLFRRSCSNAKVLVLFTDGCTTAGGDAAAVAAMIKEQGVTVYAVGLNGNGGVDEAALSCWVSDPACDHLRIAPNAEDLEELFAQLAGQIASTGATNIILKDTVNDCFRITAVTPPSVGTARRTSDTSVKWKIDELGAAGSQTATLSFTVQQVGDCFGTLEVNKSIAYTDDQNHAVEFPSPLIDVTDRPHPGPCPDSCCPDPVELEISGCGGTVVVNAAELQLDSPGHILQLNVLLRNVCAEKQVALAAWLTERDDCGHEQPRGFRTLLVPAHHEAGCRDIEVRCLQFVLPREQDNSTDPACARRTLYARFLANYLDAGPDCSCHDHPLPPPCGGCGHCAGNCEHCGGCSG